MTKPDRFAVSEPYDTLPKLMLRNARDRGNRPAFREKDYGIWQTTTWAEVADNVRALALGLLAEGLKPGEKAAIVGDNRPELYWAFLALQSIGAVPVPIYQDSVADEMQFVLNHAEVVMVFAENQEQVDKILGVKDRCPTIRAVLYKDDKGLHHYTQPLLKAYAAVQEAGRAYDKENPGAFKEMVAKGEGAALSLIAYTSGTTGQPKGVMLSFDNVISAARGVCEFEDLSEREEIVCYLPMAWIGDHFFFAQALVAGFTVNCPESSDTLLIDLREVGPTFFFAPPAIFENVLTTVMIRMEDAGRFKRKLFDYFVGVARRVGVDILEGRRVSPWNRLIYKLGDLLIYGPLRDNLGFRRIRVAYTAGAPLGPDIFNFYRAIGVNLKQLYGQTESTAYVCIQPDDKVRPDAVGPPAPGCEVKIAENGEIMFRSPGTFIGYFKNDEATGETKTADGWVHTGDAGIFTDDGQVKVIDRAKDVGQLKDGTLFAPQYIENKLKFFPFIKEAVAFGHERDYVACFVNIDLQAVGNWAERQNLAYTGYTDLAMRDDVYDLVADCVRQVNKDLSEDSELAGSQIRRFLVLHKELDADDGELTRTRKVRRGFIREKYQSLLDALYSDAERCSIEAEVTFEDGRKGKISAELKIRNAETFGRAPVDSRVAA